MPRAALRLAAGALALAALIASASARAHTPLNSRGARARRIARNELQAVRADEDHAAEPPSKIPHILHYVHLAGYEAWTTLSKENENMDPKYHASCVAAHEGWEVKFWSMAEAEKLLHDHYDWFLPVWKAYRVEIERANAIRAFIMHRYGGVYMDLDVECYSSIEKYLGQYDLILQGVGAHGVINSAMASVPGHTFFERVHKVLQQRYWWDAPPLVTTGMGMLVWSTACYFNLSEACALGLEDGAEIDFYTLGFGNRDYKVDGFLSKIAPVGELVEPCLGNDGVCQHHFQRGIELGTWDMEKLVGRHHYANTWIPQAQLLEADYMKRLAKAAAEAPPSEDAVPELPCPT